MKSMTFLFLAVFALSCSGAAAKTYTIEESLGEFRFSDRYYSYSSDVYVQELDGLPGFSRAEFKAAWDAQVKMIEDAGFDPAFYLPANNFEEFYEEKLQKAKEFYGIAHWYTDGLTVSATSYDYFPRFPHESAFGIVQSFGESVFPRSVRFSFDTPQDLVSIELSVGAQSPDWVPPYFEFTGFTDTGVALPMIPFDSLGQTTFQFDDAYRNVSQFSIRSGLHPNKPVFTGTGYEFNLRFDQLTVKDPNVATVPVPAMFFPFMLAALGLFGLKRKARVL